MALDNLTGSCLAVVLASVSSMTSAPTNKTSSSQGRLALMKSNPAGVGPSGRLMLANTASTAFSPP